MDEIEIASILRENENFLGCFASDQLPHPIPSRCFPKSMIINTAAGDSPGEHWVAIVLQKKRCFYFDSFGLPILNGNILKFLAENYKKVTYTDVCIQSVFSDFCGKFCIGFINQVHSKYSYHTFINRFDFVNLYKNDAIIENILLYK